MTTRRSVYYNHNAQNWNSSPSVESEQAYGLHQSMPGYAPSPLIELPQIACEIGVGAVYVKDESSRFGLTSFKTLGASWGTIRSLASAVGFSPDAHLDTIRSHLVGTAIEIYAATEGNHGRAVAWMGRFLGLPVHVHVPATMHPTTIQLLQSEEAHVVMSKGDYNQAVSDAYLASHVDGGIFIQDFAFEGYDVVPQWIVDGYQTMMQEIDTQLQGKEVDLVLTPVGVGSLAQAVVTHSRRPGSRTSVLAVEPDTAACLHKSLKSGSMRSIQTTPSIMAGMNCATPSSIAWHSLQNGVRASLTVADIEAHLALLDLKTLGISAGPCGASGLAALRSLGQEDKTALNLTKDSVIVMISSEGSRSYDIPLDITINDATKVAQQLVQINSTNATLVAAGGSGETAIARYIAAWLEHRDIECHWIEPTMGRPSVVGVVRGSGGGKSLIFNGHIDTVTLQGYDGDALSGNIKDGKLYGRGSADMKGGVAAAMVALANCKRQHLKGDVIFTGVADEEDLSIGTEDILKAGWRADAAVVNEPTNLSIINAHRGFVWLEVEIHGVAVHGSRNDLGIDAITKAGYFLVELDKYAERLRCSSRDAPASGASIHASLIKGGEEASSYPALCTVTVEKRTVAGETSLSIRNEIERMLLGIQKKVVDFKFSVRAILDRPAFNIREDSAFCQLLSDVIGRTIGQQPVYENAPYWTDCALLTDKGIPAVIWGPIGEGLHAKEEWVGVESIQTVTEGLISLATQFCG